MNINSIDKNFLQENNINLDNFDLYDVKNPPFDIKGVYFDKDESKFVRMPKTVTDNVSGVLTYLATHTSGGRVRFSTNSKNIVVIAKLCNQSKMSHMALSGSCGFSLCQKVDGGEKYLGICRPDFDNVENVIHNFIIDTNKTKFYTLYFPLYSGVESVFIGIDKGATLGKGAEYENIAPIFYYGSSITQGGCASRPDTNYQGIIHKQNNVDFINLGFSGNANAEVDIMEYISKQKCSVFVLDYDHNASTIEYLKETHYRAYKIFRNNQPKTPIIMISRPRFDTVNTLERRNVIYKTFKQAKKEKDKNVYFIDGLSFFKKDSEICTVDTCHPTDLGFYKMAKGILKTLNKIL